MAELDMCHDALLPQTSSEDQVRPLMDLHSLRASLTEEQRRLLDAIWKYHRDTGHRRQWIPTRVLHSHEGKSRVRALLSQIGGTIVWDDEDPSGSHYQLTLLGVLLTSDGQEIEDLLARYLSFLRKRFVEDPEFQLIESREVQTDLGLSDEQTSLLGEALYLGAGTFWGVGFGVGEKDWRVGPPPTIDDLPEISDLHWYVREQAITGFDPTVPIEARQRGSYLYTKQVEQAKAEQVEPSASEFWSVVDPVLRAQLEADWHEAQLVYEVKAWKACLVLCGGIVEGLLFDVCRRRESEARLEHEKLHRRSRRLDRWGLDDLITVAQAMGVVEPSAFHLSHALREYRNLVHPAKQTAQGITVAEDEAAIAINIVRVLLRNLAR